MDILTIASLAGFITGLGLAALVYILIDATYGVINHLKLRS